MLKFIMKRIFEDDFIELSTIDSSGSISAQDGHQIAVLSSTKIERPSSASYVVSYAIAVVTGVAINTTMSSASSVRIVLHG